MRHGDVTAGDATAIELIWKIKRNRNEIGITAGFTLNDAD